MATARGTFTSAGGVLSSPESGVSIVIPEGAIPDGVEQQIYFKVCKDNNFMPPLDSDRGNMLCYKVYAQNEKRSANSEWCCLHSNVLYIQYSKSPRIRI